MRREHGADVTLESFHDERAVGVEIGDGLDLTVAALRAHRSVGGLLDARRATENTDRQKQGGQGRG